MNPQQLTLCLVDNLDTDLWQFYGEDVADEIACNKSR